MPWPLRSLPYAGGCPSLLPAVSPPSLGVPRKHEQGLRCPSVPIIQLRPRAPQQEHVSQMSVQLCLKCWVGAYPIESTCLSPGPLIFPLGSSGRGAGPRVWWLAERPGAGLVPLQGPSSTTCLRSCAGGGTFADGFMLGATPQPGLGFGIREGQRFCAVSLLVGSACSEAACLAGQSLSVRFNLRHKLSELTVWDGAQLPVQILPSVS